MKKSFLIIGLFAIAGCYKQSVKVTIEIQAKDNNQKALPDAKVFINKTDRGATNSGGELALTDSFSAGDRIQLEIKKESDDFYYAPYITSVKLSKDKFQNVKIDAELYAVMKPRPVAAVTSETAPTIQSPKSETPLAQETAVPEVGETPTTVGEAIAQAEVEPAPSAIPAIEKFVTFHAYHQGKPIQATHIYLASSQQAKHEFLCSTNVRGRCAAKLKLQEEAVKLIAKNEAYSPRETTFKATDSNILRFGLRKNRTVDIEVYGRGSKGLVGLAGVKVLIAGKEVGATDQFGSFIYHYKGRNSDFLPVTLLPPSKEYSEDTFETDFVVSGPMRIKKVFAKKKPDPVQFSLEIPKVVDAQVNSFISLLQSDFNSKNLIQVKQKDSPHDLLSGLILASASGKQVKLHIKHPAGVEYSRSIDLAKLATPLEFKKIVNAITLEVSRQYPFEGRLLKVQSNNATINMGAKTNQAVQVGQKFEVMGILRDKFGASQETAKIAELKITKVMDLTSEGQLESIEPRTLVSPNLLVVRQVVKSPKKNSTYSKN
jgi:hypothetical protein